MMSVLTRQTAERLIEAAIAAPSMHNSQPWRFVARLADRVIEVYADPARTLGRGDPRGRAVHIACGSALFNLRLAVMHAGYEPVARLLPSPRDPLLLASVRLAGPYRARPAERDLHAAIYHSGHAGHAAQGHVLTSGLLAGLTEAAALEGASLRRIDPPDAGRMLRRSVLAVPELRTEPGYLAELVTWAGGMAHVSQAGDRNGHRRQTDRRNLAAGQQLAVISIGADDRAGWLRAGQATQRVLLLAAHRGLPAVSFTLVLDLPEWEPAEGREHPAMIVRLGSGPAPVRFRRPVAQVLRVIPPLIRRDKSPGDRPPPALPSPARQLMSSK